MRPYVSLWVFIGPCASLRILLGSYGPNRSLCVLMVSNGSVWVLIGRYESLRYLMGVCGSEQVLMRAYGF